MRFRVNSWLAFVYFRVFRVFRGQILSFQIRDDPLYRCHSRSILPSPDETGWYTGTTGTNQVKTKWFNRLACISLRLVQAKDAGTLVQDGLK